MSWTEIVGYALLGAAAAEVLRLFQNRETFADELLSRKFLVSVLATGFVAVVAVILTGGATTPKEAIAIGLAGPLIVQKAAAGLSPPTTPSSFTNQAGSRPSLWDELKRWWA